MTNQCPHPTGLIQNVTKQYSLLNPFHINNVTVVDGIICEIPGSQFKMGMGNKNPALSTISEFLWLVSGSISTRGAYQL